MYNRAMLTDIDEVLNPIFNKVKDNLEQMGLYVDGPAQIMCEMSEDDDMTVKEVVQDGRRLVFTMPVNIGWLAWDDETLRPETVDHTLPAQQWEESQQEYLTMIKNLFGDS